MAPFLPSLPIIEKVCAVLCKLWLGIGTLTRRVRALVWVSFGGVLATVALCLIVVSCAPKVVPTSVGTYKVGKPYFIKGVRYVPREDPTYNKTGIASWYGKQFHGRRTANGEIYDMNSLTAAHPTLPLPTKVRVTNLDNGKSLVLRVNDRGPFANGRIIDVSRRSAQLLGFKRQGTAKVRVEYVGLAPRETFVASKPKTTKNERNAVAAAPTKGVQTDALAPPGLSVPSMPEPLSLSPIMMPAPKTSVETVPVPESTNIFIQTGAFLNPRNANRMRTNLASFGPVNVWADMVDEKQYYRVRMGPLSSVKVADIILAQLIAMGHTEAHIIIE